MEMLDIMSFISFFLGASWDFFTEIEVPGTGVSVAALFVGLFLANLGLRFLGSMLGIGFGSDSVIPWLIWRRAANTKSDLPAKRD